MSAYVDETEVLTGDTWNGKPIYRKVMHFASGPGPGLGNEAVIYHGIQDIDVVTLLRGMIRVPRPNGVLDWRPLPYVVANPAYVGNGIEPILFDDHLSIFSGTGDWTGRPGFIVLEYTKTTD